MDKMNVNDDITKVLLKVGLEDYEIENVFSRNKYLKLSIDEDIMDIIKYLYTECKLDMPDIRKLIIKNPLVLNESFTRIEALEKIYKTLGIDNDKYKEFINKYDKALSLNPKELADSVSDLYKKGYAYNVIGDMLIKNPYMILK